MKDTLIGLLVGFAVGVTGYYLVDGVQNKTARMLSAQQQRETQAQLSVLQQLCPEVLQKVQKKWSLEPQLKTQGAMVTRDECPIVADWQEMKAEFRAAVEKVDGVHNTVQQTNRHVVEILDHVKHLEKLDVIAQVLGKIARHLLYAVVVAMTIFGGLLTMYVVRDSATTVHATGPGGTSLHVEGQPG